MLLAGCASLADEPPSISGEGRAALEAIYDGPLFVEPPPGAGDLLGEGFPVECGEEGADPIGGSTWVLLDDGEAAIAYYKEIGQDDGWEIVEERAPDPDATGDAKRASLVMRRSSGDYSFHFSVLIGRSSLHDEVEVGAHVGVDEPSLCR